MKIVFPSSIPPPAGAGPRLPRRPVLLEPAINANPDGTTRSTWMKMDIKTNTDQRYAGSEAYLDRARRVIPLGSQTFSKSITQYPVGISPLALARGKGGRVWDLAGHEYLDFVNALLSISLGYCDPDVDKAVAEQLALGTIFSLP